MLYGRNLGEALHILNSTETVSHNNDITVRLNEINNDYQLMLSYMLRGFKDPERMRLYDELMRRLFRLTVDMELNLLTVSYRVFSEAKIRTSMVELDHDDIKRKLEDFVSDIAILDFDTEEDRKQKEESLYSAHHWFMSRLFDCLFLSKQWNESDSEFYENLICSPSIDTVDAQMIVSAISLSAMQLFDIYKLRCLINIYENVQDTYIRHRALVGLAFGVNDAASSLFPEEKTMIAELLSRQNVAKDLLELQMQVFYCMNAEKDNEKIQQDIMPDLMKGQQFSITRDGIMHEKDEDDIQEILHPEESEHLMEQMENGINKMMDMQRSGSDIYFGGFSQMKRFPFFYTLSNWFVPFFVNHTDIRRVVEKFNGSKLIENLLNSGPFCDSDKYSFILAMETVLDKIPQNMRELLDNTDAFGPAISNEEMKSAAYIRRMYLQDLYRFYKLFTQKEGLYNPFEENPLFLGGLLLCHAMPKDKIYELAGFLLKQKRYSEIEILLSNCKDTDDTRYIYYKGLVEYHYGNKSAELFKKVTEKEPDNEKALRYLARAGQREGDYNTASDAYEKLLEINPEDKFFVMNKALCDIKLDKTSKAVEAMFKLEYNNADDKTVQRVLAWALINDGRTEQAISNYEKLLSMSSSISEDNLNMGYCLWIKGEIEKAVEYFKRFKKTSMSHISTGKGSISKEFESDSDFLHKNGITDVDIRLMIDIVDKEIGSNDKQSED